MCFVQLGTLSKLTSKLYSVATVTEMDLHKVVLSSRTPKVSAAESKIIQHVQGQHGRRRTIIPSVGIEKFRALQHKDVCVNEEWVVGFVIGGGLKYETWLVTCREWERRTSSLPDSRSLGLVEIDATRTDCSLTQIVVRALEMPGDSITAININVPSRFKRGKSNSSRKIHRVSFGGRSSSHSDHGPGLPDVHFGSSPPSFPANWTRLALQVATRIYGTYTL